MVMKAELYEMLCVSDSTVDATQNCSGLFGSQWMDKNSFASARHSSSPERFVSFIDHDGASTAV